MNHQQPTGVASGSSYNYQQQQYPNTTNSGMENYQSSRNMFQGSHNINMVVYENNSNCPSSTSNNIPNDNSMSSSDNQTPSSNNVPLDNMSMNSSSSNNSASIMITNTPPPSYTTSAQNITQKDLEPYYETPIKNVAALLNVSLTQLKRICRSLGIPRWPYRKIHSLKSKINEKKIILEKLEKNESESTLVMDPLKHHQLKKKMEQLRLDIRVIEQKIHTIKNDPKSVLNDGNDDEVTPQTSALVSAVNQSATTYPGASFGMGVIKNKQMPNNNTANNNNPQTRTFAHAGKRPQRRAEPEKNFSAQQQVYQHPTLSTTNVVLPSYQNNQQMETKFVDLNKKRMNDTLSNNVITIPTGEKKRKFDEPVQYFSHNQIEQVNQMNVTNSNSIQYPTFNNSPSPVNNFQTTNLFNQNAGMVTNKSVNMLTGNPNVYHMDGTNNNIVTQNSNPLLVLLRNSSMQSHNNIQNSTYSANNSNVTGSINSLVFNQTGNNLSPVQFNKQLNQSNPSQLIHHQPLNNPQKSMDTNLSFMQGLSDLGDQTRQKLVMSQSNNQITFPFQQQQVSFSSTTQQPTQFWTNNNSGNNTEPFQQQNSSSMNSGTTVTNNTTSNSNNYLQGPLYRL